MFTVQYLFRSNRMTNFATELTKVESQMAAGVIEFYEFENLLEPKIKIQKMINAQSLSSRLFASYVQKL